MTVDGLAPSIVIRPESVEELNKLVAFIVENPEIKVQLSSHTDSRGTTKYNQKLVR